MKVARRSIGAQRNPESQKAILKAARELIAAEGVAGFSIEGVAKRAKAGKPTIYRWWPSRTLHLLDVYAGLKQELDEVDSGSLEGDIAAFLIGILGFWQRGAGDIFRSVLAEAQSDAEAQRAVAAFHHQRSASTTAMLARRRPGEVPLTPEQARRLASLTFSYGLTRLMMGELDVPETEIREIARMLAAAAQADR